MLRGVERRATSTSCCLWAVPLHHLTCQSSPSGVKVQVSINIYTSWRRSMTCIDLLTSLVRPLRAWSKQHLQSYIYIVLQLNSLPFTQSYIYVVLHLRSLTFAVLHLHSRTFTQPYIHIVLYLCSLTRMQSYICLVLHLHSLTFTQSYIYIHLHTLIFTYIPLLFNLLIH